MLFIDFQKTLDSVEQEFLRENIRKQGVQGKTVTMMEKIYRGAEAYMKTKV